MASMPAVWTSPEGSSPVRRSTPRPSTPTVCGAACTKRAKTALRNGAAPRTAPVASPLLLERALAGCFRPAANHGIHRKRVLGANSTSIVNTASTGRVMIPPVHLDCATVAVHVAGPHPVGKAVIRAVLLPSLRRHIQDSVGAEELF